MRNNMSELTVDRFRQYHQCKAEGFFPGFYTDSKASEVDTAIFGFGLGFLGSLGVDIEALGSLTLPQAYDKTRDWLTVAAEKGCTKEILSAELMLGEKQYVVQVLAIDKKELIHIAPSVIRCAGIMAVTEALVGAKGIVTVSV